MDMEYCPYCMAPVKPGEPCGTCMLTAGSYTPAARHLPPGTVLQGRYLVGRVLGEGGFGITYIGRDLVLGLKVAIKEYFPADKATRDAGVSLEVSSYMGNSSSLYLRGKANFLREAQTIARLDRQPNIVSVKDFFEANNTAYIVMEYIDGTTFKELVEQRGGKLPAWELLHLIEPMFAALGAMHKLDLIHRDISPENLMLEQGTVRLLDFGCARESANGDATMTIMLRHGYAPLEQYQSSREGQGPWTDIYALAATIYYCITGKKPPQAMDRLLEDQLTSPRKLGVDLSERQETALLKGLSVLPRTRFQSAEEFHTALYLGQEGAAFPLPDDERQRNDEAQPRRRDGQARRQQAEQAQGEEEAPTPEERPEEEKEEKPETPRESRLPAWLKAHKKIAGAAAAAILAVVFLAAAVLSNSSSHSTLNGPGGTDQPGNTGQQDTAGRQDTAGGPDGGTEASGREAYVYHWDLSQFRELMGDERVSVIVIPDGEGVDIDTAMEVTKPVRLEPSAQLHLNAEVELSSALYIPEYSDVYCNDRLTVTGGGRIEVDGYWGGDGMLRTVDGGSIRVGDTGHADFGTLWLERSGDLEAASDHINLDQSRYVVADEDSLFQNAVHIASFEELESAANDRRADAIVIDGSFEMEYWITVNKPVLISEGAVLTTRRAQTGITFGDTLINRGRVEGDIQLNSAGTGGAYFNYGSSDIGLDTEGGSCILNFGEIRFRWGNDRYSSIVNIGQMSLEQDDIENVLNIVGCTLMNYGEMDLVSGRLRICANGYFSNRGTAQVSAQADIENGGHIWTGGPKGTMILEGGVENHFGVLEIDRLSNMLFPGGAIEGGLITSWEDCSQLEESGNIRNGCFLRWRNPDGGDIEVSSAPALLEAEETGPKTPALRWTGNAAVEGDLVLRHDLIVNGTLEVSGTLTMDGGILQNYGTLATGGLELRNGAFLLNEGGEIRLTRGTLTLSDSFAVSHSEIDLNGGGLVVNNARFLNQNTIRNIGGILVDDGDHHGSYLYNRGSMELREGAGIDIGQGVFTGGWLDIGGDVTIGSGGQLNLTNGARFYNAAAVTVANDGELWVRMDQLQMDGGTSLINDGYVFLDGWEMWQFNLDGEIVNRSGGFFQLCGEPMLGGVFRNEGELEINWGILHIQGEFNNQGTAFTYNGEAGFQGNWTGRELAYR